LRIGVTITKDMVFRNKTQEFHNTYYFNLATAVTAPSESIVDELTTKEKNFHATTVNFKRAQVWTAGGTPAQNQMIFQKTLTGAGSQSAGGSMDRERAVLIRWKAGFDSRGLQVYLRKWYHSCGNFAGEALTGLPILANTDGLSDQARGNIAAAANGVRNVGGLETWELCSKTGRSTTHPAEAHRYLEHHQLGEMWR
jgi:hypothetical protein